MFPGKNSFLYKPVCPMFYHVRVFTYLSITVRKQARVVTVHFISIFPSEFAFLESSHIPSLAKRMGRKGTFSLWISFSRP